MLGKERILYLLDCLEKNNILKVKEIASELNISEATIRRDLSELEKQNKLKRIHGGAIKSDFIRTKRSKDARSFSYPL